MNVRPILFSGEMVRALLDGRKSQTRRVITSPRPNHPELVLQDWGNGWAPFCSDDGESANCDDGMEYPIDCPYGKPGDLLYVRETWAVWEQFSDVCKIAYRASERRSATEFFDYRKPTEIIATPGKWKPSTHMPRWASRLTLRITNVRVERLQDISDDDALAEGIERHYPHYDDKADEILHQNERWWKYCRGFALLSPVHAFAHLWDSINAKKHPWDSNPFVWVVSFEVIEQNVDQVLKEK